MLVLAEAMQAGEANDTHNMYCIDFSQDKLLPFQSGKGLTWSTCYQVAGWSP